MERVRAIGQYLEILVVLGCFLTNESSDSDLNYRNFKVGEVMSRSSRIPSDIIDEPTQRIYLAALLIFIQARKLLDFLKFISISPDSITSPLLLNELINWLLIKWIIIDILYISLVKWLKIDRLEFDRNRYFILISSFVLFNYSLFGDWKVSLYVSLSLYISYATLEALPCTHRSI